jgi:Bacterial protein of unknown function (Gcw_chp)
MLEGILMRRCGWWIAAIILVIGSVAPAQITPPTSQPVFDPYTADIHSLMVLPQPPSVYAPVEPEGEEDGTNKGGVDVDLNFRYLTDDVYRGVSHNRAVYVNVPGQPTQGKLHASNFQTEGQLTFNLGKLPHPFVGVFSNVNDSDPLSRFQEIRPYFGFNYTIRPLIFDVGQNSYIYPERERFNPNPNTSEAYVRLTLDDSYFFLTPNPILSPYVYGAYDYQSNKGWYLEAGMKHDFIFEDFGVILSPYADVGYVSHFPQQFITISSQSSGFQHYDVGLVGTLSLNHALHLAPRYGQFSIEGFLTYTSKFSNPIFANTEVWGGVGLKYRY